MQIQILTIPAAGGDAAIEVVNAFLRSHKILGVQKEQFTYEGEAYVTFCITYQEEDAASSATSGNRATCPGPAGVSTTGPGGA